MNTKTKKIIAAIIIVLLAVILAQAGLGLLGNLFNFTISAIATIIILLLIFVLYTKFFKDRN